MFAWLLAAEWIGMVATGLVVEPRVWNGSRKQHSSASAGSDSIWSGLYSSRHRHGDLLPFTAAYQAHDRGGTDRGVRGGDRWYRRTNRNAFPHFWFAGVSGFLSRLASIGDSVTPDRRRPSGKRDLVAEISLRGVDGKSLEMGGTYVVGGLRGFLSGTRDEKKCERNVGRSDKQSSSSRRGLSRRADRSRKPKASPGTFRLPSWPRARDKASCSFYRSGPLQTGERHTGSRRRRQTADAGGSAFDWRL